MSQQYKIVVNARFLTKPITGVQRFAIEISRRLPKYISDIVFVAPDNILQEDIAREVDVKIVGRNKGHLWEQVDLPFYLMKNGTPLLINLESTAPAFYKNKITTLHDIGFKRYPESYSWSFRTYYNLLIPEILRTSRMVITVSNFSKEEIISVYKIPEDKIAVVYNAVDGKFKPAKDVNLSKQRYILAVSSINKRKNFANLLKAFSELQRKDIMLYVAGEEHKVFGKGGITQDLKFIPNVKFLGRVNDDMLIKLYSNAIFFVFPSIYEGFGIPPLEAQACGCPVLVSRASVLPETYGDSALYCDPLDINDIAKKMKLLLLDAELRKELIRKGYENVKRFSWEKSAKKMANIIEKELQK